MQRESDGAVAVADLWGTTCAQLSRLFLVFQQQGDGPKSSLELVWDGKFADKYFCLRSAAGVIVKTCFTLDRAPVPLQ